MSLLQVLIYTDASDTKLVWVSLARFHVPNGAVVVGHKANGSHLYLAAVSKVKGNGWLGGSYDLDKECAEYGAKDVYRCNMPWKIALLYGE